VERVIFFMMINQSFMYRGFLSDMALILRHLANAVMP
jgi:hypothetical protein